MMKRVQILKILILAAIGLLAGIDMAHAQNTAASPYLDSKHSYRVPIGSADNTREWKLTDGTLTYNLTTDASIDWSEDIATGNGSAGDGYYGVSITFVRSIFAPPPTNTLIPNWELQYFESDKDHNCVSARKFSITVTDNKFYLSVDATTPVSSSQCGKVHTYDEVKDADDLFNDILVYSVTMHNEEQFNVSSWQFNAQVVLPFNVVSMSANWLDNQAKLN